MFSAWDKQCGRYLSTGLNSATRQECVEDVTEYLFSDGVEEMPEGLDKESFVSASEIEIVKHEEVINE